MKTIILKKSAVLSALNCLLLIASIGLVSANGIYKSVMAQKTGIPIYSVETDKKEVCITFDAAWECSDTEKIIEILKKHNAKATFFAVAQWAIENEADVIKLRNAGHKIENHSYSHKMYTDLTESEMCDDIAECNETLAAITDYNPTLVRVPSGEYNQNVISTIFSLGLYPIQWDIDSLDYTGISVGNIIDRVLPNVKNGSIILFHNGVKNTPDALEVILTELEKQGYKFVSVDELIYKDNFIIDHEGTQKRAEQ